QYWRSHSQENVPFVVAGFFNKSDVIRLQGPNASIDFPNATQTQTSMLAQVPSYRLWELNNKPSYVYRWSLSVERQFGSWFGQIGYNGSAGRHLYTQSDANQAKWIGYPQSPTPGQRELQWAPTPNNVLGEAINPAFANIWVLAPRGSSYYNGLSVAHSAGCLADCSFRPLTTSRKISTTARDPRTRRTIYPKISGSTCIGTGAARRDFHS